MNGIELGIELLLDNLELTQPYRKNTEVAPGEYDQRDGFCLPSGNVEQQLERGQQRVYPDRHRRRGSRQPETCDWMIVVAHKRTGIEIPARGNRIGRKSRTEPTAMP
jgi:hypothetical protein